MLGSEVVSDTGPLISFELLAGGFRVLRKLVDEVLIPPEVLAELSAGSSTDRYLNDRGIEGFVRVSAGVAAPEALTHPGDE